MSHLFDSGSSNATLMTDMTQMSHIIPVPTTDIKQTYQTELSLYLSYIC